MSFEPKILILLAPIIIIALYFLFKYLEITFGLFLIAGIYKGYIRSINIFPKFFDLTVFLV